MNNGLWYFILNTLRQIQYCSFIYKIWYFIIYKKYYIINVFNIRLAKMMLNYYLSSVLIFTKKLQTASLSGKNYLRTVVYKMLESKKVFTKV